jgi:hypothetical protein
VKFGTLIRVVVFLAVFGWAGYTGFMIAYDYFDTSGMVGQLVVDAVTKRKAMVAAGGSPAVTQDIAKDVRGLILKESRRQQIALDEGSLQVTPGSYAVQVSMSWRHPIALYGDRNLFDLTLWMDRTFDTGF